MTPLSQISTAGQRRAATDSLAQAHRYALQLNTEISAAEQDDAALELAADQGVALRQVVAFAASAIVHALHGLSLAVSREDEDGS
jgi:hypothetical protein